MSSSLEYHLHSSTKWIWPLPMEGPNQFVAFRQEFDIQQPNITSQLAISADTNFVAWINGVFVGSGQFPDYPNAQTFSLFPCPAGILQPGRNVLAVLAYYCGENHFSYIPGRPGCLFELRTHDEIVQSGPNTFWRIHTPYQNGPLPRITPQMGFVFHYDARKEDAWKTLNYSPGKEWSSIGGSDIQTDRPCPTARPLSVLTIGKSLVSSVIAQGLVHRPTPSDQQHLSVAELMQRDFLSARHDHQFSEFVKHSESVRIPCSSKEQTEEIYLIYDIGCEECGFLNLDLQAGEGTIVDIAVGEHLADMRVRASIGGRHFGFRYICGPKRSRFIHFINRLAGRYIQLHIFPFPGKDIILHNVCLLPNEYPIKQIGEFSTNDRQINRIYEVSVRTLRLCMHEHYEDCPWREQALYANDGRMQALTGYHCFDETAFPKTSLDLLGKGVLIDHWLSMCAPAKIPFTIPSFTCSWFLAMRDLLLYRNAHVFCQSYLPQMKTMLDSILAEFMEGLYPSRKSNSLWHFYDWAPGMQTRAENMNEDIRYDAPLNLFFVLALRAVVQICRCLGHTNIAEYYQCESDKLAQRIDDTFWDESEQVYLTYRGESLCESHIAELTQALAVLCRLPRGKQATLLQRLANHDHKFIPATLSQSFYKYEALMTHSRRYAQNVVDHIATTWGKMLYAGATSFWETSQGERDFISAGSLCHGWSAIPAYFFQAYLLGIKPLTPGFQTFLVNPVVTNITQIRGTVPTPSGAIHVRLQKQGGRMVGELTHPASLQPKVVDHPAILWKTTEKKNSQYTSPATKACPLSVVPTIPNEKQAFE